jgi:hypothetical protein
LPKANLELFREKCIDTLELPETCFPIIRHREIFLEENFTSPANRRERGICKITFLELANRPREKLLECKNLCGLAISVSRATQKIGDVAAAPSSSSSPPRLVITANIRFPGAPDFTGTVPKPP